jgi:glycosyltransferase involved in cell wall biosynthesis
VVDPRADAGAGSAPAAPAPATAKVRVAVIASVIAHYRAPFFQRLFDRPDLDVHVFCQAALRGVNMTVVHDRFAGRCTVVPTLSADRERLVWQRLPWRSLLSDFDVVFVVGNPRMLSSVCFSFVAKLMRRPIVIYGQGHTMGANAFTERLRLAWWRSCRHLFVYTDGEVRRLKARGFAAHHVVGMNNGHDQRRIDAVAREWTPERLAAWRAERGLAGRTQILSCARLEPKNRFDLWIEALAEVVRDHPDLIWCVIGDGVERQALEDLARARGVAERIRWVGAVTDDADIAPWFLTSALLVHPAGIGLTLMHAFGFGLPVVTHGDPDGHNPEFEAFEDGGTGRSFPCGSVAGLADAVRRCLSDEPARRRMAARGLQIARETYNVDVMADRFAAIARHAAAG